MKIVIKISLFILLLSGDLFSQTITDSLNFNYSKYQSNIFNTGFEKRLNTYNLNSSFTYSLNSENFFLGLDEKYFSSLVSSGSKNIKDEQSLSILGEYKYSPFIKFGFLNLNNIYSNDRKIAINEASSNNTTAYTKISPIRNLVFIPYGGYSINKQVNEDDRGAIYGANLTLDKFYLNEFQINSQINFQNEDISPRKNTNRFASIRLKNEFDLELTNLISADYTNTRKDFYFEVDSLTSRLFDISKNIQSRIENSYFIEERFYNSSFNSNLHFDVSGRVSLRNIDRITKFKNLSAVDISTFDTQIEEFKLDFTGLTEYRSELFFGRIKVDYSEKEEKHKAKNIKETNQIIYGQRSELENRKNNSSEYTTVSALGNFVLTSKDNLMFSILHRKLIYDTPSEDNFDDRDELLSILRISYLRSFNRQFNFFINLDGSFNHTVYIFAERSSNNNIRRIIKLSSGGEYKNPVFYSKNTFEVSANYTSYDFEDINPNIRSFSFRQFKVQDSTSINFFGNIYIDFSGYVKLSEQGDFVWKNFTNNPDRYLAEYFLEPMVNIKSYQTRFGVGIRMFSLKTFGFNTNNEKLLSSKYESIGPITNFIIKLPNVDLSFYGWYEFITNESNIKRELANLSFAVFWRI